MPKGNSDIHGTDWGRLGKLVAKKKTKRSIRLNTLRGLAFNETGSSFNPHEVYRWLILSTGSVGAHSSKAVYMREKLVKAKGGGLHPRGGCHKRIAEPLLGRGVKRSWGQ